MSIQAWILDFTLPLFHFNDLYLLHFNFLLARVWNSFCTLSPFDLSLSLFRLFKVARDRKPLRYRSWFYFKSKNYAVIISISHARKWSRPRNVACLSAYNLKGRPELKEYLLLGQTNSKPGGGGGNWEMLRACNPKPPVFICGLAIHSHVPCDCSCKTSNTELSSRHTLFAILCEDSFFKEPGRRCAGVNWRVAHLRERGWNAVACRTSRWQVPPREFEPARINTRC